MLISFVWFGSVPAGTN